MSLCLNGRWTKNVDRNTQMNLQRIVDWWSGGCGCVAIVCYSVCLLCSVIRYSPGVWLYGVEIFTGCLHTCTLDTATIHWYTEWVLHQHFKGFISNQLSVNILQFWKPFWGMIKAFTRVQDNSQSCILIAICNNSWFSGNIFFSTCVTLPCNMDITI